MSSSIVYAGPSLANSDVSCCAAINFRPPVRRGDLSAVTRGVSRLLILDGEFGQSLSVTPKEILRILECGVAVIGAASMGALRAAELSIFGMTGVGWIYECYRSGAIDADDEVALAYDPDTFKPLTVPLVNVRYWARQLAGHGALDRKNQAKMIRIARRIFFAERSTRLLLRELARAFGENAIQKFLEITNGVITDIKRFDAEAALTVLKRDPTSIVAQQRTVNRTN